MSNITELLDHGQSLWLDYIDRGLLVQGGLRQLVSEGLRGVTSNPTIFYKSIAGSDEYDETILDLIQADHEVEPGTLHHWLTVEDVQMAADILEPVYNASQGGDGYVSIEVSPHLAYNAQATIEAARHLAKAVNRPNVMIKVPATREGLPAIEQLTAEGININVTLLFAISRYAEVIDAYVRGLQRNDDPGRIASVASFFVSRVDTKVDPLLDRIGGDEALALRGRTAIANAKLAYRHFRERFQRPDFLQEKNRGARVQRLLWGSTSTKNPDYSDVLYVNELIGRDTVNTVPPQTLDAFLAHGEVRMSLEEDGDRARRDLDALSALGIDFDQLAAELEREGVEKFAESHDQLLAALRTKRSAVAKRYAAR